MSWFKKKNYQKLWSLGDIGIEDVPDDVLYTGGRNAGGKQPSLYFPMACEDQMKARREARGSQ